MREFLSKSLEQLLLNCPLEQRELEMREVERMLRDAGIEAGSPRRESLALFAWDLFHDNPGTWPLVLNALSQPKAWNPVEDDAGPADMVARLMPGDGYLE
jgi:hypothetical protein